ncbi:MAG: DUF4236 domain-containing protein [Ruminococcaceae bacterium]|jgi:hypothetical protein|nr:DUF4236 domain-containing protein [Oscillospiraceae bacterium]
MGSFRFRKSIQILPGVKLNINKKSVSISIGKKGAHYTVSSNGTRTKSIGIPGTGLSYVDRDTSKTKKKTPTKAVDTKAEASGTDVNGDGVTDVKDVIDVAKEIF